MHKPLLLWVTVFVAIALVPTALAGATAATRNGTIAFTVQFDTPQLFSIRPSVSKPERLTTDLAVNYQPVASPDGRKIAFARGLSGRSDIFVNEKLLNEPGEQEEPTEEEKAQELRRFLENLDPEDFGKYNP